MRGAIDEVSLQNRCCDLIGRGDEIALCYHLPPGRDGLHDGLSAQRALTQVLRAVFGPQAEQLAVFVVTEREGESIEDLARAWGATEVGE
jgi:hypothetical protein